MRRVILLLILIQFSIINFGQIIADHRVVDRFDDIPAEYIVEIKKMWLSYAGESHSAAIRTGLTLLESLYPAYDVSVTESGTPEAYTTSHLRASRATWGSYWYSTGWQYAYGEGDWYNNPTALSRTKAGISYCNTNSLTIGAFGYGWCWDMTEGSPTANADPVYGVHWYGRSVHGPEGDKAWGLDAADYAETGNSQNLDSYLNATQEYIDYCTANSIPTKVFFTTGTVDMYTGECGYQGSLKNERIRDYVDAHPTTILFDYADILCYNDAGLLNTTTWNGHTYPILHNDNDDSPSVGHIGTTGALRLAKAMWWMLARIAGWDGSTATGINSTEENSSPSVIIEKTKEEIRIRLEDSWPLATVSLYNLQGTLISSKHVSSDVLVLDISTLSSGIYFILLSDGRERFVEKVVIL